MAEFTLEEDVDRYVMQQLESLGLKQHSDYHIESEMDPRLKEALKGGAKTKQHSTFGKPDLNVTIYNTPVLFENKLNPNDFVKRNSKGEITHSDRDIRKCAVNGGLHYARVVLDSKKYDSCVVVATAGRDSDHLKQEVYYVYAVVGEPKHVEKHDNLKFLANKDAFDQFIKDATLTQEEKHRILVQNQQDLNKQAKKLNKLMNDEQIDVADRAAYVSGLLLAMQPVRDYQNGVQQQPGLVPDDLKGYQGTRRDAIIVTNQIRDFLNGRHNIPSEKINLMMATFNNVIRTDPDRDVLREKHKIVAKLIAEDQASITKQLFTFLYENIYLQISDAGGALDLMGTLYSEFLKYALSDGRQLGIVLTPSYVTDMMARLVGVNMDSHVMDLATGSGSFLISSMNQMIADANEKLGINTDDAKQKIELIKHEQLLGSEINAKLFSLCSTNFILRQDGSSRILKADSFTLPDELFNDFKPTGFLLNPPFSYKENGMPFVEFGLNRMVKGGLSAVIIQDSAGSGKAKLTNQAILKHHTLLASIKMPTDLFEPSAGVQTSVYLFKAGEPHNFARPVNFVDFRNDGYKRTKRGLNEIDHPIERYQDIVNVALFGRQTTLKHPELWDLDKQVFSEPIGKNGDDWNWDQHVHVDVTPHEEDFLKVVGDYLDFEIGTILRGENY